MIRGALLCAEKELKIRLRDRWAMLIYLMLPLTIAGMVISVSGGSSGPQPTAQLLVVDQDDSFLSQTLLGAMTQAQDGQLIQAQTVKLAEGQAMIDSGDGTALLIIPAGFSDSVLSEEPATLELITNPAQQILPGILEEFLKVMVDGVFYLHRVFGEELALIKRQIDNTPESGNSLFTDALIASISISINNSVESITDYLDPAILELTDAEQDESDESGISFGMVFFPGTIFMGILFAAQGMSDRFWIEREKGTLRRSVVSPLSLAQIFAGSLLSGAALLLLLTGVMATLGFLYLDLSFAMWLPAVLWLTLSGLVMFGLMALLQLLAPSQKAGSLITNLLVFPLMMAGGAFFPFEALPDWIASIGRWVPNGFLLERLKSYLVYDGGLEALLTGLPYALAMALLLWGLCAWRLAPFAGSR